MQLLHHVYDILSWSPRSWSVFAYRKTKNAEKPYANNIMNDWYKTTATDCMQCKLHVWSAFCSSEVPSECVGFIVPLDT